MLAIRGHLQQGGSVSVADQAVRDQGPKQLDRELHADRLGLDAGRIAHLVDQCSRCWPAMMLEPARSACFTRSAAIETLCSLILTP